jgi:hypothetical protein
VPPFTPASDDERRRWDAALLRKALRHEQAQRHEQIRRAHAAR